MACASTGPRARKSTVRDTRLSKTQNSYYYFLSSSLKNAPQTYDDSVSDLKKALKKDPDSGYLLAQMALVQAQVSNWKDAFGFAERALQKDPKNTDIILLLGKLNASQGSFQKALGYYKQVLALDTKKEEVYNVSAREYLALGQTAQALSVLSLCQQRLPEVNSCKYYRATILLQNKKYNEAIQAFRQILQYDPDNLKVLQTIAEIHLELKQNSQAIELLKKLKKLNPSDVTQSIRLGVLYYELKKIDLSIAEFEAIHERLPQSERVNYFLGLLYQLQGNLDKSYGYFDAIKEDSKFFKESFNRMIYILRSQKKYEAAIDLLNQKLTKKDLTPEYLRLKVALLMLEEDYDKAFDAVNDALKKGGNPEMFLFQRAVIYDKKGHWDKARKDLEEIIASNPDSYRSLNYLGYTLAERGEDLDAALEYVQKAMELRADDGHIVDSLAWVYFKKGDSEKALSLLQKAERLKPDEPTVKEHMGDVYFELKNKRVAREFYERALSLVQEKEEQTSDDRAQIKRLQEKLGKF